MTQALAVIATTHQPIFLPWPGLFYKARHADVVVLLDDVQFPLGRGWMTRNRLKSPEGELWLRVPVLRKGRSGQRIGEVELSSQGDWRRSHMESIRHHYIDAPWLSDYLPGVQAVYEANQRRLVDFNVALIRLVWEGLGLRSRLVMQSELGVTGGKTPLLVDVCKAVGADEYVSLSPAEKYIDPTVFGRAGIGLRWLHFRPPLYPQLWGWGIYNLSALDLLLNCGPKSLGIIEAAGPRSAAAPPS